MAVAKQQQRHKMGLGNVINLQQEQSHSMLCRHILQAREGRETKSDICKLLSSLLACALGGADGQSLQAGHVLGWLSAEEPGWLTVPHFLASFAK